MTDNNQDILIIGTGIAGLSAALSAAENGFNVTVLSKSHDISDCNTSLAQGGIVGPAENDSPELLASDITIAGDGLNFENALREFSEHAPFLVKSVLQDKCGVDFTLDSSGKPDLTKEAAHSVRRIYYSKDRSGKAVHSGLLNKVKQNKRIKILGGKMAVDIITINHHSTDHNDRYRKNRAAGAYVLDVSSGEVHTYLSPVTVIAAGGIGRIYRYTSNPPGATGDGIAMAYRAGVPVINAEFVQFHPTTLFHRDFPNFLISETLRGEGAVLLNKAGQPFMHKYNNKLKELAPRDEVSRAIYFEMEERGDSHVFLDASVLKNIDPAERFPGIYSTCLSAGIDMRNEPVPVVPAAHYFCGGIKASLNGETDLAGLYALGESACTGIHGANRLASVSLLEGLYSGISFGQSVAEKFLPLRPYLKKSIPDWISPSEEADPAHIRNDLENVQSVMWNYVGISRTVKRMQRALSDLDYLNHRIYRFYREARPSRALIEMRNAALCASVIARSAIADSISRGCHYLSK